VQGVGPGARYLFRLSGELELPDPASRFQPDGVHEPSEVVDLHRFGWLDTEWRNPPLAEYVIYELHVGTFTEQGTFDAAARHLDELTQLGVNAVEPMPIGQFPGDRNWGYDGVYPFAAQSTYGGPGGFQHFVDECHRRELAVVLDVVYNHVGPEGNYLGDYGPYFTPRYRTPWGEAINFDGAGSDEVRDYFIANALMWFEDFHVDALRLDAIHGIIDASARPFLQELGEATRELSERLGRPLHLIAEDDRNDPRFVRPVERGGIGLDGQWNDDFHHALHALVTGERQGYYTDFGSVAQVAKALTDGYVLDGRYSVFRGCRHGAPATGLRADQMAVFGQNHDQVGNRAQGERLSTLIPFERQKLVAGVVLLSPYVPLLFMGEEYGEVAPFPFFVSFSDAQVVETVRAGRTDDFAAFAWKGDGLDPQDPKTFLSAKLDRSRAAETQNRQLWSLHRELLRLRRVHPVLSELSREPAELTVVADEERSVLTMLRRSGDAQVLALFNFGDRSHRVAVEGLAGRWWQLVDSSDGRWGGPGSGLPGALAGGERLDLPPDSFVLYDQPAPESR
jgi:maltooligosyltrehalose trehalohydrolase